MTALYRARIAFVLAVIFAVAIFAIELPFSALVHQRQEVALSLRTLKESEAKNSALRADIAALNRPSVIAAIAHENYGLVKKGQRSIVILPSPSSSKTANGLTDVSIPPKDLATAEADDPAVATPSQDPPKSKVGFWSGFVSHLEFWRSV